jgi:hypothetical protein
MRLLSVPRSDLVRSAEASHAIVQAVSLDRARRQLLLPVTDNYFCRRRAGKGVRVAT